MISYSPIFATSLVSSSFAFHSSSFRIPVYSVFVSGFGRHTPKSPFLFIFPPSLPEISTAWPSSIEPMAIHFGLLLSRKSAYLPPLPILNFGAIQLWNLYLDLLLQPPRMPPFLGRRRAGLSHSWQRASRSSRRRRVRVPLHPPLRHLRGANPCGTDA